MHLSAFIDFIKVWFGTYQYFWHRSADAHATYQASLGLIKHAHNVISITSVTDIVEQSTIDISHNFQGGKSNKNFEFLAVLDYPRVDYVTIKRNVCENTISKTFYKLQSKFVTNFSWIIVSMVITTLHLGFLTFF